MTNLFDFDYEVVTIKNRNEVIYTPDADGTLHPIKEATNSRFGYVIGEGGMIVHTKKEKYTPISTNALSQIGNAFKDQGHTVSTYVHKYGEVIGMKIDLTTKETSIGKKTYSAYFHCPNNGSGIGKVYIGEVRFVCANGIIHLAEGGTNINIPHNLTYIQALEIAHESLIQFVNMVKVIEAQDANLDAAKLTTAEAEELLNKWFYAHEMPTAHKKNLTETQFRAEVYGGMDNISKSVVDRYDQLKVAFEAELGYNKELELDLSKYTVFAAITNYLSRRREDSGSTAPNEVQTIRAQKKVDAFMKTLVNA